MVTEENNQSGTPNRSKLPRWAISVGGSLGLALAIFVVKPMLKSDATPAAGNAASIWSISSAKDPMTDAMRNVAVTTLQGQNARFELHVTCGSDKLLRYELDAFDAENKPLAFRSELTDDAEEYVSFQVRIDQAPAVDQRLMRPQFSNQIFVETRPQIIGNQLDLTHNDVDLPVRMAQGSKILFRVPVSGGDETLSIAQTDPAFHNMLTACLPGEGASAPAATSAPSTAPITDTSAVEVPTLPSDPKYASYYNEAKRDAEQAYGNLPPAIVAVLGQEAGANDLCRGSPDEAITAKWCPVRDRLVQRLESMGMCYGRPTDQSAAESVWHLCNDGG